MQKSSNIDYPVSSLIRNRKSIRAFATTPVEQHKIFSLFEATRWAPSSTNEQPWLYIYATKDQPELWDKMFDALLDGNKLWAKEAPLLILSLARKNFTRFHGINAHAMYDLGAANSFLSLQAVEVGLQIRQMAGFNAEKAKAYLNIPDDYELGVFMAVGYPGDPESLPEVLKKRELEPRERFFATRVCDEQIILIHLFYYLLNIYYIADPSTGSLSKACDYINYGYAYQLSIYLNNTSV